ncbi:hypothetical protein GCM10009111_22890 [Colwellia asteriadis]|uniref:25S rRNA (uridine-N(3))-methyltransferase BMT5-like domain-containing protein n=1 Tax=Colwellia asteriadis TaxID=517723 RepID=A0ABN1L8C1_9GAMM
MYINSKWRILTVGDGDLSFSASLVKHHKPRALTATVFDTRSTLIAKYGSDEHYQQLLKNGANVLTSFDVTEPSTWQNIILQQFDLVIFQFPLIPGFSSKQDYIKQCEHFSINTLNRRLLRIYLQHCFKYFLADNGAKLAYISSKDVKPYRQWNIEHSLTMNLPVMYLGKMAFNITEFPGYRIRNVDRDKHVKDTQGFTYVYSDNQTLPAEDIQLATFVDDKVFSKLALLNNDNHCAICRTGLLLNELDKKLHFSSKKHLQMQQYEQQWHYYLSQESL